MKRIIRILPVLALAVAVCASALDTDAFARAGGGRSIGSRGSRSYSVPGGGYSRPSVSPTYAPPSRPAAPFPAPQPAGGGFMRSLAGGMVGGFLGGMLFRGLGFGGGYGGGGVGLFDILLLAGIAYVIYRIVRGGRRESPVYEQSDYNVVTPSQWGGAPSYQQPEPGPADVATGLSHIRQMDPSFDEARFRDAVLDIFFRIQGACMNRDLAPVSALMTEEIRRALQEDVDRQLRERRINRLENIAVRTVDIAEAWQESGHDYITALVYANLLDYVTDESGTLLEGSKSEPVKFEEYWTLTRPVGNNPWRLSAIDQK